MLDSTDQPPIVSRCGQANRVNNLQKDKNNLEGPKNEAINFLKKENELIESKNLYYQLKV